VVREGVVEKNVVTVFGESSMPSFSSRGGHQFPQRTNVLDERVRERHREGERGREREGGGGGAEPVS